MQIHIIAVGKLKSGPEKTLIDTYIKRCPWQIKITEVEERRPIEGAERMAREGDLILKAIPKGAYVIALDERGKKFRSVEFAKKIETIEDMGQRDLVFLIGGADGYDPKVKAQAADLLISLGDMTWPHMMVRAMISEQIYRASTILSNHPYHKD